MNIALPDVWNTSAYVVLKCSTVKLEGTMQNPNF